MPLTRGENSVGATAVDHGTHDGVARMSVSEAEKQNMAAWFVGAIFAICLSFLVLFGFKYASRMPYYDEWVEIVPVLSHKQSVNARWLWSLYNEHCLLLPRIVMLSLLRLSHNDFRIGAVFNVGTIAAVTAGALATARRVRGRFAYADAALPILLLSMNHHLNLFVLFQCQIVLAVALQAVVLFQIVQHPEGLPARSMALCCLCCLATVVCGEFGLLHCACHGLYFLYVGWLALRGRRRRDGFAALATGLLVLAAVGMYLAVLPRGSHGHLPLRTLLRYVMLFLRTGLGSGEYSIFTELNYVVPIVALIGFLLLFNNFLNVPGNRARALGLALNMSAGILLAVAISIGRGAGGPGVIIIGRYALMAAQTLLSVYFVFLCCAPQSVGELGHASLLAILLFLGFPSASVWSEAASSASQQKAFLRGLQSGMPVTRLIARYGSSIAFDGMLLQYITDLKDAGIPPYTVANVTVPPYVEQQLPENRSVKPTYLEKTQIVRDKKAPEPPEETGQLTFVLPKPTYVNAIRVHFIRDPALAQGTLEVSWHPENGEVDGTHSEIVYNKPSGEYDCVIYIENSVTTVKVRAPVGSRGLTVWERLPQAAKL